VITLMLNKVIILISTCVLSLSVHADIYHFNGIVTSVTGPAGSPPDNPYNIGEQFNFTIEVDFQSPGYGTIGGTVVFLPSTENYTYYAAEYISGDAVENVAQDGWTNHFYIDYTSGGTSSINVLNDFGVFSPTGISIDSWDADTDITFIQTWRIKFDVREIRGQITSFTVDNDSDSDGVDDNLDNCTLAANADQRDSNDDGFGNACDPDLDNNGIVNAIDLGLFKSVFFTPDADADFDGNGIVNAIDLGIFKASFFQPPGPSGVVP